MDHLRAPKSFPMSTVKLALTKISLVWQIFGGNDLSDSKGGPNEVNIVQLGRVGAKACFVSRLHDGKAAVPGSRGKHFRI